ncbi:MAG: tryptophan-rich sensory protein [Crocinitomicaceae bacterium]|nr:MAG: tryptophan-rich sensory protein [Crocinitomicaceae bacterium]
MKLGIKIAIAVICCLVLGGLSGIATVSEIKDWYLNLNKPSFNPPNWLFGPAWSTLYTLMGISFALVWNDLSKNNISIFKHKAGVFFGIQFVLNLLWSTLFFSLHQIGLALVEMLVLLGFIVFTTIEFSKINRFASALLIPYILWVSFATVLTASILYLN